MSSLEPIPETVQALVELEVPVDSDGLLQGLRDLTEQARKVVPELVGVSIARPDDGLTFTLVATDTQTAALDAVQYAAGGPCVQAATEVEAREFDNNDVLDEKRWLLFAEATAARGIRSTLTLPVVFDNRIMGTINLYASSRDAFVGHHEVLAEIFGAFAAGAVANADLPFSTLSEAVAAPDRARELRHIDFAVVILAAQLGIGTTAAEERLHEAAAEAGVSVGQLALQILEGRGVRDHGEPDEE